MKKFFALLIAVLMVMAFLPSVVFATDEVSLTGGGSSTTSYDTSVYIAPSIVVNSTNNLSGASITIHNLPEDCEIEDLNTPAGIMVTVRADKKVVSLAGDAPAADYQQALRGIRVTTKKTATTTNKPAKFDIAIGHENTLYNQYNQHFYEFVPSDGIRWDTAKAAAEKDLFGMTGYLATITSEEENKFVYSFCGGRAWLGGSDADVEGEWKWMTGPENGTKFWQGGKDGTPVSGMYSNWQPGVEPNEHQPLGEDYLHIYGYFEFISSEILGKWNDFYISNDAVQGYVIEWGGMGDDPVDVVETCQLTIEPTYHTVSFNSHGGSTVAPVSSAYGLAISKPSCTLAGYDLVGWFKTEAYNTEWNFSSDTVSGDMTLHAKWEPRNDISYNVEHYQQDVEGEGYTPVITECYMGTMDTTVNAVAKTYTGFTENTTHSQRVASGKVVADGSLMLKLYYDRDKHTVSFNSHGGSSVDTMSNVRFGSTISKPSCTLPGYELVGWFKTDAYNTQWNFIGDTVSSDMMLHAKWAACTDTPYIVEHYKQNVDGDGYTLADVDNMTGTTNETVTAVAKTYTGLMENTTHEQRVAGGTIAADGTLVLKLYYDREDYTVSFNSHGGSSVDTMGNVLFGSTISKPSCILPGYDLVGWFKTDAYNTQWNFISDTVSDDMALHAKWTACTDTPYTVEHYKQDIQGEGYTLADADNMMGTTDETVTAVAKAYSGLMENTTHEQRVTSGTVAADGSLVLKLYYDREEYTVAFDKNTTDAVTGLPSGQTKRYGDKVAEQDDPMREDFEFIGWYKEIECINQWSFETDTVQANTTLYAKWSQNRFAVSYDNNGGSGTASEKQYDGETFTLHDGKGFSKDDFVIEGWNIDGKNYELGALYTMPTSDVIAKAIWSADGDNDGISDKDETAAGTDPGDEENTPDFGTVRITVLNSAGKAEAGLTCVLNSQPVTATTDANGIAIFKNVALAPHTLSVRSSSTQLGTYSIDFSKGSKNGTKISDSGSSDSIGGVTATVTSTFLTLDLTIKQSGDGNWAIDKSTHTEQVPNPTTGTWGFAWLWMCAAAVLAACGVFIAKRRITQK